MRLFWLVSLALLLGACSTTPTSKSETAPTSGAPGSDRYHQQQDTPPHKRQDVSQQAEPTPKEEPQSRYGNPDSYTVWGKTYQVLPSAEGYLEEGKASWYGQKFHGFRTSSGETFDMYQFTAAHRTLPLPTYARVTNLDNGKKLVVRINDRGPFHDDRIIDLSWAAAVRLGIEQAGIGNVRVEALTPDNRRDLPGGSVPTAVRAATDSPPPDTQLYLQSGAFSEENTARQQQRTLQKKLGMSSEIRQGDRFFRVWLGPYENDEQRRQARRAIEQAGLDPPLAVEGQ